MRVGYLLILSIIILSSCGTSKYLNEDQTLLTRNEIIYSKDSDVKDKTSLNLELQSLMAQKPNSNFALIFPREWYYFRHSDPGDTSWYNNWVRESFGEPPAFYKEEDAIKSSDDIEKFLRNIKGYFNAEVDYEAHSSDHRTVVDYNINTGRRYQINSIQYIGTDEEVLSVIEGVNSETVLKKGMPVNAYDFDLEKNRIVRELQNQGYVNFNDKYLEVKGDSSNMNYGIDFYIDVRNPTNTDFHKKYTINEINIYTDFKNGQDTSVLETLVYNEKKYRRDGADFIIKPSAIDDVIFMEKESLYSRDNRYKTLRKLSGLGTYKFVNIAPFTIPGRDSLINYNIFLTPYENKWIADAGLDLFYSTLSAAAKQLIGFSVGGALQNRNTFGGAERNRLSAELAFEFELFREQETSPLNFRTNTVSISLQDNLEIPRFKDWIGSVGLLNNLGILKDSYYQSIKEETTTQIGFGYNYQKIIENYDISRFNFSYGFRYKPNKQSQLDIRQIGLDYYIFDTTEKFDTTILKDNPLLRLSFEDVLLSGFLLREISFLKESNPSFASKNSWAVYSSAEFSGLESMIANGVRNALSENDSAFKIGNVAFANFIKLQLDGRYYKGINQGSTLAFRLFTGIVIPYYDDVVNPYISQFYSGGPNSIRAWQSRELGPGRHLDNNVNSIFFQTGDLKLEFNLEYRFDIFWIIEGAFFLDGGNVWTLKNDVGRPGSQFGRGFISDIALGGGYGIRWDLTYFHIRADFGYKLRTPYLNNNNSHWNFKSIKGFGNANFAVNYPF